MFVFSSNAIYKFNKKKSFFLPISHAVKSFLTNKFSKEKYNLLRRYIYVIQEEKVKKK